MKRTWMVLMLATMALWLTGCRIFDVEDDLYDIDKEQATVSLQLLYVEHSTDRADVLPSSYGIRFYSDSELPNPSVQFVSARDGKSFTNTLNRSVDTLSYNGYLQPGSYRLLTYNNARGFQVDATSAEVERHGTSILAMPESLYLGSWSEQLTGGEQCSMDVHVRQRTRRLTFRVELEMSDMLTFVSSTGSLSNVCYRLDIAKDSIDRTCLATMPLAWQVGKVVAGNGTKTVELVCEANVLSPSAAEFAAMGVGQTLTMEIRLAGPSGEKTVEYSFEHALDEAYRPGYVEATGDLWCIEHYEWRRRVGV